MSNLIILPADEPADSPGDENQSPHWTQVAYTMAPKLDQQGRFAAIAGKACGIRSDGNAFWVAYDLPWIYPQGFDWTEKALARLNTFLDCGCSMATGCCSYHQMMSDAWTTEDELRNSIVEADIPEPLRGHVGPSRKDNNKVVRPS